VPAVIRRALLLLLAASMVLTAAAAPAQARTEREYVYAVSAVDLHGTLTVAWPGGDQASATTAVRAGWPHASAHGAYAWYRSPAQRPPLNGRLWAGWSEARWTGTVQTPERQCPLRFHTRDRVKGDWRPRRETLMLELPNITDAQACGREVESIAFSSYATLAPQAVAVPDATMRRLRPSIPIDVTVRDDRDGTAAALRWTGTIQLRRVRACRLHVGIGCVTSFLR
jgi:hypothetical protein